MSYNSKPQIMVAKKVFKNSRVYITDDLARFRVQKITNFCDKCGKN